MSILQEIYKWSQKLPAWQQDAIARLYSNRQLSQADVDACYALLQAEHGIGDEKSQAFKLAPDQIAQPVAGERLVQLAAIKNLVNVNALAENQRIPISLTGITAIFGENGAGKSGYSRVLKKACRARDQREPLLPDARKPGKAPPARATFELLIDGKPMETEWSADKGGPVELSDIAIFDSLCARAYVDNQGDFSYAPYGLDILEGLVKLCNILGVRASKDRMANIPDFLPFATLAKTQTTAGIFASQLSAKTNLDELDKLCYLNADDLARLDILTKTLAEGDPRQKAQDLRARSSLLEGLVEKVDLAIAAISDQKLQFLRSLIDASNSAKEAARLAASGFEKTAGLLPGTGTEAWQELFEKARDFAAQSHAGHSLNSLAPEDLCPLCQNSLGQTGSDRLAAFDAFIEREAEKAAKTARATAIEAFSPIKDLVTDLGIKGPLLELLKATSPGFALDCDVAQATLTARKTATVKACADGSWIDIPGLPVVSPSTRLTELATKLRLEAKALDEISDEKARATLGLEKAELEGRVHLLELKSHAISCVEKSIFIEKLASCITDTVATGISRKSTELSKTMATQEVADALNEELAKLNVHELQVFMKPESPGGKTQFKLALQHPGGGAPSSILSEGEARAIAIASFLAEVRLGRGRGGIVFDDPVSSLDHRRRAEVALRLAHEAKVRQVIVFTHDIYFLRTLEKEANSASVAYSNQRLRKASVGFGVQSDRMPFDVLGTRKRIGALREMQVIVSKAHKDGDDDRVKDLSQRAYHHLRLAWERGVEEILLNDVIVRYGVGVSTQRLKQVTVGAEDYKAIDAGMSKSSTFEHDGADMAQVATPHPDTLLADIEALAGWCKTIEDRRKTTKTPE